MDAKITRLELLLDKINLLFAQVKEDGALDKLEADLLLKYIHQLESLLQDAPIEQPAKKQELVHTIPPVKQPDPEPEIQQVTEQPKVQEIHIPQVEEIPVPPLAEKIIPPVETPIVEPQEQIIPKTEVPPVQKEAPVLQEYKKPEEKPQRKPLVKHADDEEEEEEHKPELDSKLKGHHDKKTLADKITSHKSKDLMSVIDLSTRIALQRQLFQNDKSVFDAAIKAINALPSYAAAEQYILQELKQKYAWKDADAIEPLLDVVRQKFN